MRAMKHWRRPKRKPEVQYLNLDLSYIDSTEYLGSSDSDCKTWMLLLRFCVGQENGGIILGCGEWSNEKWQMLCRVTKKRAQVRCDLWHWEGQSLKVHFYPHRQQQAFAAKRDGNSAGGQAKTQVKTQAARENGKRGGRPKNPSQPDEITQVKTEVETQVEPNSNPSGNPTKGRKEERKEEAAHARGPTQVDNPTKPKSPPPPSNQKPTGRDNVKSWLALKGFPNSPSDVDEWHGGMVNHAEVGSPAEAQAFLDWVSRQSRLDAKTVDHWRHARPYADVWRVEKPAGYRLDETVSEDAEEYVVDEVLPLDDALKLIDQAAGTP